MGNMGLNFINQWHVVDEPEPAPLDLSDTEILDWLGEFCEQAIYNRPTPQYRGGFIIYCDNKKTKSPTLRGAVCLAAAKHKAANADY
jgi:hypothetical protein